MLEQLPPETIPAALIAWTIARVAKVESRVEEISEHLNVQKRKRSRWRAAVLVIIVVLLVLLAANPESVREAFTKLARVSTNG